MRYNPLSHADRIEKTNILTNRIFVKALQSDRGDIIRAMNVDDLKTMLASVFHAVHNELAVEAQLAYDYYFDKNVIERDCVINDKIAEFKPRSDVEIEEDVTAFFEIDGKLQYRDVTLEDISTLEEIDNSVECLTQQMEMEVRGMQYDSFSVSDRLERAGILANGEIMHAVFDELNDAILEMSPDTFKQMWKHLFIIYYQELAEEAANIFEQACEDYDAKRDGIENDPRKKFKPKTEFEIDQELAAYFAEHGTLH